MTSSSITSWKREGEKVETVTDFILARWGWGSKITLDSECNHEIKTCLLLGRKAMTDLDSISKAETSPCHQMSI